MSQVASQGVAVGAASRPYPGEALNGDAWQIDWHGDRCRITVIDGLGHGPDAALAATLARDALMRAPELLPLDGLRVCHRALAGTRGAAISVASIDLAAVQLTYAGVGNVMGHLWQDGRREQLVGYPGIVGAVLPTLRSFSIPLQSQWLIAIHTDGISARFRFEALEEKHPVDPHRLAEHILTGWGRSNDDATVVVARGN